MALIFYSMAGEGRGHATRVRAMVEALRSAHDIVLFAPGDAYEMLAPRYAETNVSVHRIPGLRFHYTRRESLDRWGTLCDASRYLWQSGRLINRLQRHLYELEPDLVITDFEPALPRAALRCGVPFLSLDHQHFLVENDLSSLPPLLRLWARAMGIVVRGFYRGQAETIISSFYNPPLLRPGSDVTQVGVLLRPEILQTVPREGDYLLAYLRRKVSDTVLDALRESGLPVRVYGLGARPTEKQMQFFPICETQFVHDLAGCAGLVCTAGNQLVGEALHLGKPLLVMPESNNFEQAINAHFLRRSGAGGAVDPERLTFRDVQQFVERLPEYRQHIPAHGLDGTPAAVAAVQRHLHGRRRMPMMAEQLVTSL